MRWPLTEAAARAMRRANAIAHRENSVVVEPLHLLEALVMEDSRATEILDRFDVTEKLFECRHSVRDGVKATLDSQELAQSRSLHHVVAEARQQSAIATGQREVGSEHLLYGLAAVESPASELLNQEGIDANAICGDRPEPLEPLAVDFEIQWQSDDVQAAADAEEANRLKVKATDSDHAITRILDAAANRAREGLRVIEDFTRFVLNDGHLSKLLKECRHELAAILSQLPKRDLLASRDTPGDVGTAISTPAESVRNSSFDVVAANFKRVQESVRSLEEYGKCLSAEIGRRCEAIRYRLYTVEKAVLTTATIRQRLMNCRLYFLLTRSLCRREPEAVLQAALTAGVNVIQIREKEMPDGELLAWAKQVRKVIDALPDSVDRPLLVMNDRPDLAVLCDADGVHVGQDELSVAAVRRVVGPSMLVGVSTHDIAQARQAILDGADYLGVGPVFPSATKSFNEFAGLEFVRQVAEEISLPWFAIGGITNENLNEAQAAGASRIAISNAIAGAEQPGECIAELLGALTPSNENSTHNES